MEILDPKTLLLIVHLLGVALGAGGAFMSDVMFVSSIKDAKFTKTELRFLHIGGMMVWTGLAFLVFSGIGLTALDWAKYSMSSKFIAKMVVVGVIVVNGIIFHVLHLPLIKKHVGVAFVEAKEFLRRKHLLLASGAVSMVSWVTTIILGAYRSLPWTYWQILLVYAVIVSAAAIIGASLHEPIIPSSPSKHSVPKRVFRHISRK